mgnify:CR=1 FL=1
MDTLLALRELLKAGGLAMLPLLLCSVAAGAATLHLLIRHALARVGHTRLLEEDVRPETLEVLESVCLADRSALGEVMATTIQAARARPGAAPEVSRRAIDQALDSLESGLVVLAFIAQAAPLFGLLGTVLGMVDLFASMESAGDKVGASTLASGIWKALITTATGLGIAIPALGLHALFSRRLDRLALRMEEGAGRVLDLVRARP